jgi:hypothetical protein
VKQRNVCNWRRRRIPSFQILLSLREKAEDLPGGMYAENVMGKSVPLMCSARDAEGGSDGESSDQA